MKPCNAREILNILKKRHDLESDSKLADLLGVAKGAVTAWHQEGKLPDYVLAIYDGRWIMRGSVSEQAHDARESPGEYREHPAEKAAALANASLDAIVEELVDAERRLLFETTQQLRSFSTWRTGVEESLAELRQEIDEIRKALKK